MRMIRSKSVKYMKNERNIRKNGVIFSRRIMSAAMCALLTLQPLGVVFALDVSDSDIAGKNDKYTETEYFDTDSRTEESDNSADTAHADQDASDDGNAAEDNGIIENDAKGENSSGTENEITENEITENDHDSADEKAQSADDDPDLDIEIKASDNEAGQADAQDGDQESADENDDEKDDADKDDGEDTDKPEKLSVNYSWYICAGTDASSYTIADAASLKGLANIVNGTDLPEGEQTVVIEDGTVKSAVLKQTDFSGKTITLINDIDLSELEDDEDSDVSENGDKDGDTQSVSGWTPVGTANTPFAGIFNGNGKKINNLRISDESLRCGDAAGLFGHVSGEVRDLSINGSIDISVDGSMDAGLLAGVLTGKAVNIDVTGNISIVNGNAGGLTGAAQQGASIERAACAVSVNAGSRAYAAGIAGRGASVRDSYNMGSVSGGIAAGIVTGEALVSGCFNTGNVKGSEKADAIGGAAENCFALDGCVQGEEENGEAQQDDAGDTDSDDTDAAATGVTFVSAGDLANGSAAWKLNTASGSQKNSEVWTQGTELPDFASAASSGPVYRLVMSIAPGVDVTAGYSDDAEGAITVGVEKAEISDDDVIPETENVNYYYIKGKALKLTAKAAASDGESESDDDNDKKDDAADGGDKTPSVNLAYAVIKDSLGRVVFSASTKSFAADGLVLACSPETDSMSGELLTYPDAEDGAEVNITFDANGGRFGGDADKTSDIMSIAYGSFMSEALYDRDDPEYSDGPAEFTGWYIDKACSIPADGNAILAEDMTLYAGWIRQCEITFDLNGYGGDEDVSDWPLVIKMYTGSPADAQTAPVWTSTSNSNGTITRHNFLGWFTEPEGGEAWNFDMPVTDSMTLYAHWEHVEAEKPDSSSGGVTSISGGESFQKLLGTIQDGMSYAGQTITFDEDIELDDAVVISSFDGILDGQGHTLKLNKKQFTSTGNMTALFRNLKKGAEIKNINIVYEDGGDVSSSAKFAVLCDTNHGTVKNCTLKLSIRKSGSADNFGGGFVRVNAADGVISGCTLRSGSSVSFNGSFGGIVGENRGQVSECSVEQNVKISASKSAGGIAYRLTGEASAASPETYSDSVDDPDRSGSDEQPDANGSGDTGNIDGTEESSGPAAVKNCSVSGDITSDTNARKNSDKYYAGGIVAEMDAGANSAAVEKCFVTGNVTGKGAAGGIVGVMRGGSGIDAEEGTADKCITDGCYTSGSVSDAAAVGGIAGLVRGGSVKYCYSTAALKGAEAAMGGIAGAGGDSQISGLADNEDETGSAAIESCYWFGSEFSADRDADQGMFCGGKSENVTVKNCYFGATDDKPGCTTDEHLSDDDQTAAVKKASEFADGTVAWALETSGGEQKEHIRKFSMNAKPANAGAKAASSGSAGDGDDAYAFVRDTGNYSSPVLSSDSIYRAEVVYDEDTDQNVTYDKTKDYVKITVGKTSMQAYGGASSKDGGSDDNDDPDKNNDTENDTVMYMYGSGTLTWRENSADLHNALSDLVEKLIIEENDDSYNILNTYTVTISDTDGNVLNEYKSQEFNRLGKSATYKLGGYDLKIDANVFKTITKKQILEEDKKDDDTPEPSKPSGGRHHSSSGSQSGNTNGNGGNGTNEDANGKTDGDGIKDSGAPARPDATVPVISDNSDDQVSLVLPTDSEQPSDVVTDQPDAEPEAAQEAAPDSGEQPDKQDDQKQDEPEQQPEQAQPQTVFEVIRKSVEENPVSMVAAGIVFIVIIAAAAIHRIRRDR